jgi:hypothetical protein
MKAIFLDIDGVLNSEETPNPRNFPYFVDRRLVDRFTELVRITDATVILSSSWRIDPIGLLAAKYYSVPFDDVCPDMPANPGPDEILTWLRPGTSSSMTRTIALMNCPYSSPVRGRG